MFQNPSRMFFAWALSPGWQLISHRLSLAPMRIDLYRVGPFWKASPWAKTIIFEGRLVVDLKVLCRAGLVAIVVLWIAQDPERVSNEGRDLREWQVVPILCMGKKRRKIPWCGYDPVLRAYGPIHHPTTTLTTQSMCVLRQQATYSYMTRCSAVSWAQSLCKEAISWRHRICRNLTQRYNNILCERVLRAKNFLSTSWQKHCWYSFIPSPHTQKRHHTKNKRE